MKVKNYILAIAAIFTASISSAQEAWGPTDVGSTLPVIRVSSLASRASLMPDENKGGEAKDRRSINPVIVIGKDKQKEDDYFVRNRNVQEQSVKGKAPSIVFDAYTSNSQPTDPAIAVGPNHVVAVWNTAFRVFNKDGSPATGQLSVTNIFSGGGCCDLTISYDQQADRWVASYLFSSNGRVEVAVSTGPDPVNDDWNVYTVPNVQDYNKLSVGPNGYYISANTSPQRVWVLNRNEMVLGDNTAGFQVFNIPGFQSGPSFNAPQVANVSDSNMPDSPATLVHMADDAWAGVSTDHLNVWSVEVDFENSANSSISTRLELDMTPFIATFDGGGFSNLSQPGGSTIDALQNTIMNQAQVRKFDDHNSLVLNFVVDTDASNGKLAGIRWVELRQDDELDPWSIYQEGTYTSPDGKHAWAGSMIMDKDGNIALGYTAMSGPTSTSTVRVSSFYTGRMAADPIGTMTIAEEVILGGNSNIPGTRYGDYAKIDIDPNNDLDFWFITEMMNSGRKGVVGKFTFTDEASRTINDIGVIDITSPLEDDALTSTDDITVLIHNFGTEAVTDPEVQYIVDGGSPVVENYDGTIQPEETVSFTFSTQANMSNPTEFLLQAQSNFATDEVLTNNDTQRRYPALLGIDSPIESSEIIVTTLPNKIFEISLNTSYDELLNLIVFNALGQQVAYNNIEKKGNTYTYTLDMSYAAAGVYLINMGDQKSNIYQTAKIIVK